MHFYMHVVLMQVNCWILKCITSQNIAFYSVSTVAPKPKQNTRFCYVITLHFNRTLSDAYWIFSLQMLHTLVHTCSNHFKPSNSWLSRCWSLSHWPTQVTRSNSQVTRFSAAISVSRLIVNIMTSNRIHYCIRLSLQSKVTCQTVGGMQNGSHMAATTYWNAPTQSFS